MRLLIVLLGMCIGLSASAHQFDVEDSPKPVSHLDYRNNPENFQFAIVTDNTSSARPGVFEAIMERVDLLQPEFVISVGDLIQGYTEDEQELDKQWRYIEGVIDHVDSPFYYVPGNHDLSNSVMRQVWAERRGSEYYHFVYKNVLFLVLNTEDPPPVSTDEMRTEWAKVEEMFRTGPEKIRDFLYSNEILQPMLGTISDRQRRAMVRAIKSHRDVRWTFLFMHRPIWHKMEPNNFAEIEKALEGRGYTAFAGHEHSYMHLKEHSAEYMTLGTSGGGWITNARIGPRPGQFDHVTWVTMGDKEPIFAHILASGIFEPDNVPQVIPGAELCGEEFDIECKYERRVVVPKETTSTETED